MTVSDYRSGLAMGNVYASEAAAPPPPPAPSQESNPGTVEDLHNKVKEILPMAFEGSKLLVQKGLSNNFQVGLLPIVLL